MRSLIFISMIALATTAGAQHGGGSLSHVSGARHAGRPAFVGSRSGLADFAAFNRGGAFGGGAFGRGFYYPLAFGDPLYSDYLSSTGYPVAAAPPVIYLQSAQPAASGAPAVQPQGQPLMIELQGNRYVRVSGDGDSSSQMIDDIPASSREDLSRPDPNVYRSFGRSSDRNLDREKSVPPQLPAVTLVFRDRHREEVSDYTIADGSLYTHGNYYADGSWTRKIELSSLNLPETIESNEARGVTFRLPSAPNEVIVRP